ncbi:MAG TPA: hypothetical protein VFW75_15490, partial [Acetobacteraceae bacterium]|nr:hypothetical protein [Acetobacteraceae bacterium]
GQEVEDLPDSEDTDVDEPDDDAASSGLDAAALTRELAELIRRVAAVTDSARKADLGRLATQARAALGGSDLPGAVGHIRALREALDAAANGQGANGGAGAGGNAVAYAKSRLAWIAARKKIESEIDKLRGEIVATYQDDGIAAELEKLYRARVAPVLSALDESLADKLDEATNATDPQQRAALVAEAKGIMQGYEAYLSSEKIIADLDSNPFVPLAIQKTVSATLSALEKAVH